VTNKSLSITVTTRVDLSKTAPKPVRCHSHRPIIKPLVTYIGGLPTAAARIAELHSQQESVIAGTPVERQHAPRDAGITG
jgi:hypothetical protein